MNPRFLHSWNDIFDVVKRNSSINLIAKAVTPWNALSIDALIFCMIDKGLQIRAAIVIAEHYQAGYMIDESFFVNTCSDYYYLPYDKDVKTQERYPNIFTTNKLMEMFNFYKLVFGGQENSLSMKALYYVTFNHTIPDAIIVKNCQAVERKIILCHSEEGVGAYMGTFDKTYKEINQCTNWKDFHSYVRNVFFGRDVYRLLHKTYSSLTLHKTILGLRKRTSIFPYYRRVFQQRNMIARPRIDRNTLKDSIIICTTAWRRDEIANDEDLRVLQIICDFLFRKGLHMLLKTHPRDKFFLTKSEQLHCEVLNEPGLSMECLCEYAHPKAVISFSSTTLINPTLFWGISVYCLTDMLDRSKISNFYLEEIDSFKKTFANFVTYVNAPEEIETLCLKSKTN